MEYSMMPCFGGVRRMSKEKDFSIPHIVSGIDLNEDCNTIHSMQLFLLLLDARDSPEHHQCKISLERLVYGKELKFFSFLSHLARREEEEMRR